MGKDVFRRATPIPQVEEGTRASVKVQTQEGTAYVIDASEIGNHCNHGWRAVSQFQDGRVQVERDGDD